MFSNFAWSEMLVIAAVAIIVVGPKELPGMLRAFGKTIGKVKRMAGDFQRQVDDAIKEADLDEIKDIASNKTFAPLDDAKKSMEEFTQKMRDPLEAHKSVINEDIEVLDEIEAPAVEKPATKKAPAKKTAAKKATSRKAPATKSATAKKPAPKSATAKKPAPAKSAT